MHRSSFIMEIAISVNLRQKDATIFAILHFMIEYIIENICRMHNSSVCISKDTQPTLKPKQVPLQPLQRSPSFQALLSFFFLCHEQV